jgi:hypothetical protein
MENDGAVFHSSPNPWKSLRECGRTIKIKPSDFHIPSAPAASMSGIQNPRGQNPLRLPFASFRLIFGLEKTACAIISTVDLRFRGCSVHDLDKQPVNGGETANALNARLARYPTKSSTPGSAVPEFSLEKSRRGWNSRWPAPRQPSRAHCFKRRVDNLFAAEEIVCISCFRDFSGRAKSLSA